MEDKKRAKRPYATPKIEKLGKLRTLIQGFSGSNSDLSPRPAPPTPHP